MKPKAYYRYAVILGEVKKYRLVPDPNLKGCPAVYDEEGVELQIVPFPMFSTPKAAVHNALNVSRQSYARVAANVKHFRIEMRRLNKLVASLTKLEKTL